MYFVSNASDCPRVTLISTTLVIKNLNLDHPSFIPFLLTFIVRNWNFIERSFIYFSAFHNIFFYTKLAFVFHFMRDSYIVHDTNHKIFMNLFFVFFKMIFGRGLSSHFYIHEKKIVRKWVKKKKMFYGLFINLLLSISSKMLENR